MVGLVVELQALERARHLVGPAQQEEGQVGGRPVAEPADGENADREDDDGQELLEDRDERQGGRARRDIPPIVPGGEPVPGRFGTDMDAVSAG